MAKSILIKDTTKEERRQIIEDSLGGDFIGCGSEATGINYDLYIEGKKELSELAAEYKANYMKAYPEPDEKISCGMGY